MKKLLLLLMMLSLSTHFSFALEGGTLTANPDPINPTEDAIVHYDGTGTNFTNWTPKCYIVARLLPKAGESFTGTYTSLPTSTVNGDAPYDALDAKFKMTHNGVEKSGQYTITLNLKTFFGISDEDLSKVGQVGIVVHAQWEGDSNTTVEFLLPVSYGEADHYAVFLKETSASEWTRHNMVKNADDTYSVPVNMGRDYEDYQIRVGHVYGTEAPTATQGTQNTVIAATTLTGYGYGNVTFTIDSSSAESNWGLTASGGEILAMLTYTVTVPEGSNRCYMVGHFNGWATGLAMQSVAPNKFQVSFKGKTTEEYKFLSKINGDGTVNWDYVEVNADGSDASNRTWSELDNVPRWKTANDPSETHSLNDILNTNVASELGNAAIVTGVTSTSQLEEVSQKFGASSPCQVTIELASDLGLTDKQNLDAPKKVILSGSQLTYTRQAHIDGGWETLVLPFDCSVLPAGFEFEAFTGTTKDGDDNVSLNFETATSLTANQPYIMRYTTPAPGATAADIQEVSFSADHLWTNPDATAAVVGVYQSMVIAQQTLEAGTKYILNADGSSFVLVTANDVTVEPYRAYLDANNIAGASSAPKFSILHNGEGGTTGVSAQTTDELKVTAVRGGLLIRASKMMPISICTIDGRIVLRRTLEAGETSIYGLPQGIYIVNQQKLIIK